MPAGAFSITHRDVFAQFRDLTSVPPHRFLRDDRLVEQLRRAVPFDYIGVTGLDLEDFRFGSGASVDTDAPPAYIETYFAEGLNKLDPLVSLTKASKTAVSEEEAYGRHPPPDRIAYLNRMFGVRNRTVFPIRRGDLVYGGVCVTREKPFTEDERAFLTVVAPSVHAEITRPLMERFAASYMRLSNGEMACLQLASRGLTSQEIAVESGYTVDTVNSYIKLSTKKLGVSNRIEAIAEGLRRRLIS